MGGWKVEGGVANQYVRSLRPFFGFPWICQIYFVIIFDFAESQLITFSTNAHETVQRANCIVDKLLFSRGVLGCDLAVILTLQNVERAFLAIGPH